MLLYIGIAGFLISIIGLIKRTKGALITFFVWDMFLLSFLFALFPLRGTFYSFVLSISSSFLHIFWIIYVNKIHGLGKYNE